MAVSLSYAILEAIKQQIAEYVTGQSILLKSCILGETGCYVPQPSLYNKTDFLALKDQTKVELHSVDCIGLKGANENVAIYFNEPVTCNFSETDTEVFKVYGKQILETNRIFLGRQSHIAICPAIEVILVEETEEPLTLESVSQTFTLDVVCHFDATNQEDSLRGLLQLTDSTRHALFRVMTPIVEPVLITYLTEDVDRGAILIKVDDSSILYKRKQIIIENENGLRRSNSIAVDHGGGVFELVFPCGLDLLTVGCGVAVPIIKTWGATVHGVTYNDHVDNATETTRRSSTISYSLKVMQQRGYIYG